MDVPKKVKTSKQAEIHHFKATPPMLLQATTEAFESFSPKKSRKLDRRSFTGVGNSTRKKKKFLSKASSSPYRPTSNLAHWKRARTRKRARAFALSVCLLYTNMYVPPVKTKPPTKFLCKSQPSWKRAEFFFWPACRMVFATDNDIS